IFATLRSPLISTSLTVTSSSRGSLTSVRNSSFSRRCSSAPTRLLLVSCATLDPAMGGGARAGSAHHVRLQRPSDLSPLVALDLVADLDVVVVAHADAAFGPGAHFRHVVLEAPQRFELTLVDHHVVAQHPDRIIAPHVTVDHHAAGDVAELRRA